MAAGGMYDHIGGGFHRYATDARWLVPHFEKMLYDNAQLASLYLDGFQVTGKRALAQVAREILDYLLREMTAPEGGFYSATDADSPVPGGHEEEGWFFTWTPAEIEAVLGADRARLVAAYYQITPVGTFEGRSILHTPSPIEAVARSLKMAPAVLEQEVAAAKGQLYAARKKRPPPLLDDKILTAWNGLAISALSQGAFILDDGRYAEAARRAADFVLQKMRTTNGRILRSFRAGQARHDGTLDDYAFFIQGLLDLFEATFELRWLEGAVPLQRDLDQLFFDPTGGGYFPTSADAEKLLTREKPAYDGAEPSGNSVALVNLLRLYELTTEAGYRQRAEKTFAAFAGDLGDGGPGVPKMLAALDLYLDSPLEILIVSPPGGSAADLLAPLRKRYLPNRILASAQSGPALQELAEVIPLLAGKKPLGPKPTAYVCERGRCELPTSDPAVFARQIAKTRPLFDDHSPAPLPQGSQAVRTGP